MIQDNGHLMLVDFDLSTELSPKVSSSSSLLSPSPLPLPLPVQKSNPLKNRKYKFKFSNVYTCCNPADSAKDSVHPAESVNSEEPSSERSNSFVGTEEYVAPEMIQGTGHDFAVDWWCLGVVLHEMLYGTTPFRGVNRKETFYRILSKTPELVGEPSDLRDLIRKLLEKDPKQRITVDEIKGQDFFKGVDWEKVMDIARPPFIPGRFDEGCTGGIKNIDVEDYVREVFEVGDDAMEKVNEENFLVF